MRHRRATSPLKRAVSFVIPFALVISAFGNVSGAFAQEVSPSPDPSPTTAPSPDPSPTADPTSAPSPTTDPTAAPSPIESPSVAPSNSPSPSDAATPSNAPVTGSLIVR